jgi:hypothetical protein
MPAGVRVEHLAGDVLGRSLDRNTGAVPTLRLSPSLCIRDGDSSMMFECSQPPAVTTGHVANRRILDPFFELPRRDQFVTDVAVDLAAG